jgi:outer membrane protein assembly factor BamB
VDGSLLVPSDDGYLYRLNVTTGELQWRTQIVAGRIERLPFDNPRSRYDRFGSDVTSAGDRLYVGTHDGKVLALDPADGRRLWEFAAGDAVLAAPAVSAGRVVFGSYDGFVYALDAATGRLQWKRDTRGAVVSTPAVVGNRIVVGNRCYDLLGLDATTGAVAWKRYIWSSWVESSATIRDGVAYVGSSDAAAVYAFDAADGRRRWATDVAGWAWGQPAVTEDRIYSGTASQAGYLAQHAGGLVALDRRTGALVWRFASTPSDSGAYGFPGSTALGMGRVFATSLDGRVYAFEP